MKDSIGQLYEQSADNLGEYSFNTFLIIFCSVSPPGGDFSDPVTSATLGIVQVNNAMTSLSPLDLHMSLKTRCLLLCVRLFSSL